MRLLPIVALVLVAIAPSVRAAPLRVLIHASASSDLHGRSTLARFSRLRVEAEALGARVVATGDWPARARRCDVAFLLAPGHAGDSAAPKFTPAQVDDLVEIACAGGRLIVVSDIGQPQQHRVVNALLRDLGVGVAVSAARMPVERVDGLATSPLTRGLDRLDGKGLARLELSGTAMALTHSLNGTPWALDFTPRCAGRAGAGEIVVLSDLDVLDDAAAERIDNVARWRRLVTNALRARHAVGRRDEHACRLDRE